MNALPPFHVRHLEPGRGRVYKLFCGPWIADYRTSEGLRYGVWCGSVAEAHDWITITAKAKEATK